MQQAPSASLVRAQHVIPRPKYTLVPRIFIVDTVFGRTVKEYEGDIRSARRQALIEYGMRGYHGIRRATLEILVDIKRAGGWMPTHVRPMVEQHEKELNAGAH